MKRYQRTKTRQAGGGGRARLNPHGNRWRFTVSLWYTPHSRIRRAMRVAKRLTDRAARSSAS